MTRKTVAILASIIIAFFLAGGTAVAQDRDGDGHVAASAGGDDCDDGDPRRYPGNTEVADRDAHDEDCDPTTFGERDADDDGFHPDWACNVDSAGDYICGRDCDDRNAKTQPHQMDICNLKDDDCDGDIDEDQMCSQLAEWIERGDQILAERRAEAERERARRTAEERADALTGGTSAQDEAEAVSPAVRLGRTLLQPGQSGGGQSDDSACANAVQGKIAWNYSNNRQWADNNIARLCGDAGDTAAPANCFKTVMHGGVRRADGSTRWTWQDALALCRGTRDARAPVNCYTARIGQGASDDQAIKACAGR